MDHYRYSEKDLSLRLDELTSDTLRDIDLSLRKISIYSISHPLSRKAIARVFERLKDAFRYKQYFNIFLDSGRLYALNILVKPSVFSEHLVEQLVISDIRSILFRADLNVNELSQFLEKIAVGEGIIDHENYLLDFLDKKGIRAILINSPRADSLFNRTARYLEYSADDVTLRQVVGKLIGGNPDKIAAMLSDLNLDQDTFVERYDIDYNSGLIAYLVPERLSSISPESVLELLSHAAEKAKSDATADESLIEIRRILNLIKHHPSDIAVPGEVLRLVEGGPGAAAGDNAGPNVKAADMASSKTDLSDTLNQFLYAAFNEALPGPRLEDFRQHYERLLRTGRRDRAKAALNIIINHLAGPNPDLRAKALILLRAALDSCRLMASSDILDHIIEKIEDYISGKNETFEFSDLIWETSKIALAEHKFQSLSRLARILRKKIDITGRVRKFDSVVVRKAVEELNRPEVIVQLVDEIASGGKEHNRFIKDILLTIGSPEAALALANLISHDSRQVRMQVLNILSEMGKAALAVCTGILEYENNFKRPDDRRELPDEKWYIIRNAIFVTGSLKDPEAGKVLRVRINDPDIRVRREIVAALEKIGGDEAADLLSIMADDVDAQIRKAAIAALGIIGNSEIAPELINLAYRHKTEIINIVSALGSVGGGTASEFLARILTDSRMQSEFAGSHSSRDDIKVAAIKGLGRIGTSQAIDAIHDFRRTASTPKKFIFGESRPAKAADDILSRYLS